MQSKKLFNWLLFLALSITWGSSFILMKEASRQFNGLQIGAVRIFSAGLVLLPLAIVSVGKLPRKKLPLLFLPATLKKQRVVLHC